MARVLGVGGLFFKARDPKALCQWYADVLGIAMMNWGGAVIEPHAMAAHPGAATVFCPFEAETKHFEPSSKEFMINFAVDDLDGMIARCKQHGVEVKITADDDNGRFAHLMDPDGTKIELWQPKASG